MKPSARAAARSAPTWQRWFADIGRLGRRRRRRSTRWARWRFRRYGTQGLPQFPTDKKGIATREASGKVLNEIGKRVGWLIGGAADLAPSTKTEIDVSGFFEPGHFDGGNFHFGVREHAMGAIANGMTLVRFARLYRNLFDLQRLHASAHAARGAHGRADYLCVYPRFNRSWPGRADPSANRATRGVAGNSRFDRFAARRRERDRRGVANDLGAIGKTSMLGSDAPTGPNARSNKI